MIEIIYDKSKENTDTSPSENDKNEENTDSSVIDSIKLPKNIRQIGNSSGNKRIYIEDYVVTYLNYIGRPGSTLARGAILLGETKRSEIGDIIFISGAVDAQNIEFDMDESEFNQEVWSKIYEDIKENFPDLSVVGWFLSRMGFSTAVNDKIEKIHVENFPGRNKVLYITDSLECEDAFYMYEKGQLVKQRGYFIYYSQNENMQNYIIKKKGVMSEETDTEIHRKDEELIKHYREKNPRPKANSNVSLIYVASSFVVLVMLAMGITVISNYDKMKDMEVSINRLELTAEDKPNDTVEAIATEDIKPNTDTDAASTEDKKDEEDATKNDASKQEMQTTNLVITTEQTLPAMTGGNPTYYIVKEGDTLSSIAYKAYGSVVYMKDIADANKMDLEDKIYEGDEILLPAIDAR